MNQNTQFFYVPPENILENEYNNLQNKEDVIKFKNSLNQYQELIDNQIILLNNAKTYIAKYSNLLNSNIFGFGNIMLQIFYEKNPNLCDPNIEIKNIDTNIYHIKADTINAKQIRIINDNMREIILDTNNRNHGNTIKIRILCDITKKTDNIIICNRILEFI